MEYSTLVHFVLVIELDAEGLWGAYTNAPLHKHTGT